MQKFLKNHVFSLIAWILILLISVIALPNVSQLTNDHSNISLPSNVQSEVAQTIQNNWGKKKKNTYEVAIVFNKKKGKLTETDKAAINATVSKLENNKSKYGITDVLAPDSNIATRKKLQSKDGTTWVMQLNISKKKGNEYRRIGDVESQLTKAVKTSGVRTYVTGADVLQNAFSTSVQKGIKKTEAITVVFIFIVLIIVFRSPIVPLISLLTVGVSFLTSFSIVTNLVQRCNFPFSNFTQVFMVIVLFGIGTDYNILLYDKFKENLSKNMGKYEAIHDALRSAGKTILYSGSSVLIGFTALSLAKFSIYQSAVGVAVGVAVLLIVLLTLNPFFMAVLGKRMFWPVTKFTGESENKLWHGISASTLEHPILYLIVLAVVTIPFMLMYNGHLNYDDTDEIADSVPAKQGLLVVQKHFSKGMAEPSYLYIKSNHRLDNETNLKLIDQLTRQLQSSKDVSFATSVTEPYGEAISQLYVNNQLGTVDNGVDQVRTGLNKLSKGSQKATTGAQKLQSGAEQLQSGTGQLQNGADQLHSGTVRLENGAQTLQNGTAKLASGVGSLTTGAGRLSSGTHALQSGTSSLVSGANRLQSGAGSLKSGTQSLVNGLNQLSSQLSTQLSSSNKAQIAQLESALPQINSGIQQLNSALGGSVDTSALTKNLQSAQQNAATLESSLTKLESLAGSSSSTSSNQLVNRLAQAIEPVVERSLSSNNSLSTSEKTSVAKAAAAAAAAAAVQAQSSSSSSSELKSALQSAITAAQGLKSSMSSMQQSNILTQVQQLQTQVQALATASNKALPGATTALMQLSSGLSQVQAAAQQGAAGASRLNSGAGQLYSGLQQGASGAAQLSSGIGRLNTGAGQLSTGAGKLASSMPKITSGLDEANSGLGQGQTYLQGLQSSAAAKTFYIPKEYIKSAMFQKSINVYLSPDKKSAMLIVVFNSNPSATEATKRSQELSAMAKKSLQGTALNDATVAMGGQSSKIEDTKNVASQDFVRTAAIMLIGVGIALMFITRSLLQPVYILGTLLIAYLCSLSINQWIVKGILNRDMLTWNTPFFSFIMLIALGVDYSIFLMTRYQLEQEGLNRPSQRILKACGIIGTVVISAAVILGGTFAALIPSGIPTLIEVALTVIVGLLILVSIMPITLTAATKLTYEGVNFSWGKNNKDKNTK
ncbi:MMPL family transporter [Lactobacillus amylolyticus]|uniref:MMPL family transporter n=1 Tax=Lactobacillus amylolyticus TaxID=83683 RepID=UPI000FC9B219|nr:MMPL family transporter [Lactobacillus amylolyticus]